MMQVNANLQMYAMKARATPVLSCPSSHRNSFSRPTVVRKPASFCPRRITEHERYNSTPSHIAHFFKFKNPLAKPQSGSKTKEVSPSESSDTGIEYGIALQQGLREDMEDYAIVMPDGVCGHLYGAVFDGHMGKKAADYLTKNLYKAIERAVKKDPAFCELRKSKKYDASTFKEALTRTFQETDEKLLDYLTKDGGTEWNCGSTATVVMVREDQIVVANVGDSRAVLGRNGKAVDLSSEHRPYGRDKTAKEEAARIQKTGAWLRDGRVMGILAVTRAFGDIEFKRNIEQLLVDGVLDGVWTKEFAKKQNITSAPVVPMPDVMDVATTEQDEFVIMASDGLWEVFSSAQAVQYVRRHLANSAKKGVKNGAQAAAEAIIDDAIKRRKTTDNVSVVIVKLT
ncbi:hypothetical protein CYMTET_38040 [Cymbomonas tetramitiformis]|uniref:PPM-type phosphatase domain-containing protein n=1 Tax=Cymbomonas tetramitiformis TaxID=36881 RepID=A0AAE0CCQ1_9CHLO|nr:hypothetical protein CYMTET_38040 [Cymbomonas tetramitiformis]